MMSSKEDAVLEGEASADKPAIKLRICGAAGSPLRMELLFKTFTSKPPSKIELPFMGLLDLEGLFFFKQFLERLLSCLEA
jgi:hypothetical protein